MKTVLGKEFQVSILPLSEAVLRPASNPNVASLLDHLAEELAREYVRLIETAASGEDGGKTQAAIGER